MNDATPRRKILIVEKEQAIRSVLFTLLASLGCDRAAVANGRDALAELSREPFDAVFLDLRSSDPPRTRWWQASTIFAPASSATF